MGKITREVKTTEDSGICTDITIRIDEEDPKRCGDCAFKRHGTHNGYTGTICLLFSQAEFFVYQNKRHTKCLEMFGIVTDKAKNNKEIEFEIHTTIYCNTETCGSCRFLMADPDCYEKPLCGLFKTILNYSKEMKDHIRTDKCHKVQEFYDSELI